MACWEDVFIERISHWIKQFEKAGYPKIDNIDKNEIYNICQQYFEWLSKELSTKGVVDIDDVSKKLDELIG